MYIFYHKWRNSMKTRNGFVSNSSSSSFIIMCKGELTEKRLLDAFRVPKESPVFDLVKGVISCLMEAEELSKDEFEKDHYQDDELIQAFKDGKKIYMGRACDDGDYLERVLCDMYLNYKSDDLTITKEGGY